MTTEFFDPIAPHIGYSGREFDPPEGISFDSPFLRDAGKSMDTEVGGKIETAPVVMTAQEDARLAAEAAAAQEKVNIDVSDRLAEADLKIGTKVNPEQVPTDVPGWVTLNPVEDAVFPRSEMVPVPTISGGALVWAQPVYTTALNRLDIGYINATRDRVYNTVGLVIADQVVNSPAMFTVHVYKMGKNPSGRPNGELTLQWSSPPQEGTFGGGAADVRIEIGYDIPAKKGDWFAVVVHQTGAGTTPRNLVGKQTAAIAAMPGVYPSRLGMTRSGQAVAPSSLIPGQLDTNSTWVPWLCLGQTVGIVKVTFIDLFDRADASVLGTNWSVYGAGMNIMSGIARCKQIVGSSNTIRTDSSCGVYASRLATDSQGAAVKITAFDRTNIEWAENPRAQVAVRSNGSMSRAVTVGIWWGVIEIRAYTDANPAGKTMNSTDHAWVAGDIVELRVTDGVNGSTYVAYVNDAPVLEWTDTGGESSRGAGFRYAAFETSNTCRALVFTQYHSPSVGINEWKARDL
ncbi:hypothetical protein [Rhodococcus sp. SGAir0479]|uniref:hypothetical protein n=1 Tax=Rhodococcus sp. SGAir0479 TaxID=2567884 RepID=UPI0010CCB505|nr:hypothetical protein [Rhodococcus sp. SGAir0479]QCQ91718.1 hypothetical protein E7742_11060 [Rhodococcus sp. SGAir0479]